MGFESKNAYRLKLLVITIKEPYIFNYSEFNLQIVINFSKKSGKLVLRFKNTIGDYFYINQRIDLFTSNRVIKNMYNQILAQHNLKEEEELLMIFFCF